jgi:hypothetical protein
MTISLLLIGFAIGIYLDFINRTTKWFKPLAVTSALCSLGGIVTYML